MLHFHPGFIYSEINCYYYSCSWGCLLIQGNSWGCFVILVAECHSDLSVGAIVGIAIACAAAVILIAVLAYCVYKKLRR